MPTDRAESVRYWIFDRDETPQQLPLNKLVLKLRFLTSDREFRCRVTKARGYGEQVNAWDALLDIQDDITVDFQTLDRMTKGQEEWFYDFAAEFKSGEERIMFGLHDSTALFLQAPEIIADRVISEFSDVRAEPVNLLSK